MKEKTSLLNRLPAILSSKPSIFLYSFLFFYLVIYALACLMIPGLHSCAPSADTHLIMGNYTNVPSALGASIAAGTGTSIRSNIRALHDKHDRLQRTSEELHEKSIVLKSAPELRPQANSPCVRAVFMV